MGSLFSVVYFSSGTLPQKRVKAQNCNMLIEPVAAKTRTNGFKMLQAKPPAARNKRPAGGIGGMAHEC